VKEYGLPKADIKILIQNKSLADYFEEVCSEFTKTEQEFVGKKEDLKKLYKLAINYLITEIPRIAGVLKASDYQLKEKITAENFAEFIVLTHQGKISSSGAQVLLAEMFKTGADPTHIIEEKNLGQVSDESVLRETAQKIIAANQKTVADYKKGNVNALQFLVGQVMKESKGQANPQVAAEILKKLLS